MSASSTTMNLASLYDRPVARIASMLYNSTGSSITASSPTALRFVPRYSDDSDRSDSSSPQEAESLCMPLSLVSKRSNSTTSTSSEALYSGQNFASRNTSVIVSPIKQAKSK